MVESTAAEWEFSLAALLARKKAEKMESMRDALRAERLGKKLVVQMAAQMEHQRVAQTGLQKAARSVAGRGDLTDFSKDYLLEFQKAV